MAIPKSIANTNPALPANSGFINAVIQAKTGKAATKEQLAKFSGWNVAKLVNYVYGKQSPFTSYDYRTNPEAQGVGTVNGPAGGGAGSPEQRADVALPEQPILDKAKLTPEQRAEFEKKAYHDYVASYGIEVPELTAKYGLPEGYDQSKTAYGIDLQKFGAQRAMLGQDRQSALEQFDLDRRQVVSEWEALKKAIETGQIDPTSASAVAYQRNLENKTLALQQTRQALSSKGTLYGGVAQRQTELAAKPYDQQRADLQRETNSAYDQAMAQYLGNKKGADIRYGVPGEGGASQYGAGSYNAQTGAIENFQAGLTPQQAQAQGLTFFGTDPYNILIQEQERKRQLENEMKTGIAQNVGQQEFSYYNY